MTILGELLWRLEFFLYALAAATLLAFGSLIGMLCGVFMVRKEVLVPSIEVCNWTSVIAIVLILLAVGSTGYDGGRFRDLQRRAADQNVDLPTEAAPLLLWLRPCRIVYPIYWFGLFILDIIATVSYLLLWNTGESEGGLGRPFAASFFLLPLMLVVSYYSLSVIVDTIELVAAGFQNNGRMGAIGHQNHEEGVDPLVAEQPQPHNDINPENVQNHGDEEDLMAEEAAQDENHDIVQD